MDLDVIDEKAADENVTFSDLKEAHENLVEEWQREYGEWQEKVDKYIDENGHIPPDLEKQFDRLNERLDELETIKNRKLRQYEEQNDEPSEEAKAYREFLRKGEDDAPEADRKLREYRQKALATDTDPGGGYLVPENQRNEIIQKRRARSPVREFCTVLTISRGNQLKVPREDDSDFDAGWTGERESRPETDTAGWEMLNIPTHEIYAKPMATSQMLDDPNFPLEDWIEDYVTDKFSRMEGTAFVNGDGNNKPQGILDAATDALRVPTGTSGELTYDGLVDLVYDQEIDAYVRNAVMMLNRATLGNIRKIKDANNNPIWTPGLSENDPPAILGYPYFTATDMPTVGANNDCIVFGDLNIAYYIVDRQDIRFLRDPYSSKPHVEFYYTTRVGGQVVQEEALRFQTATDSL